MDTNTIITYLACVCFLFIFGRLFILPIKSILKLVFNSLLGGFLIYIINLIGGLFGFHIGLNVITSLIVGLLGLPRYNFTGNYKISNWVNNRDGPFCSLSILFSLF